QDFCLSSKPAPYLIRGRSNGRQSLLNCCYNEEDERVVEVYRERSLQVSAKTIVRISRIGVTPAVSVSAIIYRVASIDQNRSTRKRNKA
ncbi:MAG: hypothetical protein KAR12_12695, partial [Methylococcales bacterium]|nr:hypothetical protein [Methylococcales bacterium]